MERIFRLSSTHINLYLNLVLILLIGACKKNDIVLYTPKPTPDFKYTLSTDKLTAEFKDSSTNAGSWLWNFGDGTIDTAQNPAPHTFAANPIASRDTTYFVKLIITNVEKTRKDSIVKPIVIGIAKIPPTGNSIIVGNPEYGFLKARRETIIEFNGITANPIGCRFDWHFVSSQENVTISNMPTVRYIFNHTDDYLITLIITSPSGGVDQVSTIIHVKVFKGATISKFIWSTPNHLLFYDWAGMILTSNTVTIASTINGDDISFTGDQWIWDNTNTSPTSLPCNLLATPGDLSIGIATRAAKNTGTKEFPIEQPPTSLANIFKNAGEPNQTNLLNGGTADVSIPWTINNPAPNPPTTGSFIFKLSLIPEP